MNENQLGKNIARYRMKKGLSQEKVSEYMGVSRQAVTKKASWTFIGFSIVCVIAYIIISILLNLFSLGTLICMFVICFPMQLFLHIHFSNAISTDSFNGIAGFDEKIQYNYVEVKKMLVQIDLHIGMLSAVCVFLLCTINCVDFNIGWINDLLLVVYVLNFIITILINNYKSIDKIYCNDEDKKRAIRSIPITGGYILLLFIGIGVTVLLFEIKGIENNTAPAMKLCGLLLLGIFIATIGFFIESNNIKKWSPDITQYRTNRISIGSLFVCLLLYTLMCIV